MSLEVISLALGVYQTNCYLVARQGSEHAVVIDPGDDAALVLQVLDERGWSVAGILVTHGHLDHIGAVKALAEATGTEVWMARGDADALRGYEPAPYEPEHLVGGGEPVQLAGIEFATHDVPGHTAGSVAFAADGFAFVGDVLFAGSVGRTDLAGGDERVLIESISLLMRELPADTVVAPGHGPVTTLGDELKSNPFLAELR
ncbi:MAG: hydroxyacylglutathione hydrolase [Gaiellales bacterium]|nr:hydroxyacylglutathione hydrolase [Gaiellales bacterium]